MEIVAYNFDGSLTLQQPLLKAQGVHLSLHCMRQFERSVRLWATPAVFHKMARALRSPTEQGQFSLIGSGDYHHVSLALVAQFKKPLTVVIFDNHPDWMRPPHQFHCGTWVYSLARLAHVQRIVIIGLESGDIEAKHFKQGDMESYEQGKVVLFPYQPVQLQTQKPQAHSTTCLNNSLQYDLATGIAEVLAQIPTDNVYISVDKDCLRSADARTNWEQGSMPLSTVTAVIRSLRANKRIVGADTVGDFSPLRFSSPLKWIASYLDRRESPREQTMVASYINALANTMLVHALTDKTA